MYASPVLDISGCSWLGLWASSADRDAIVEPLDPTTDKLSLLARTLALGFLGENRVSGCREKLAHTNGALTFGRKVQPA